MNESRKNAPQDLVLVFRDLLLYVLLRWRSILAAAVVLAVLAGGFRFWQDSRRYEMLTAGNAPTEELSDSSLAKVRAVLAYRNAYESACAYNKSALLMHIDPEAVPTRHFSYLITGERPFAVAALLQKHLAEESLYTAVTGKTAPADDPLALYLAELVTTTLDIPEPDAATPEADAYLLLNVAVVAPTEELCTAVAQVVEQRVETLTRSMREELGAFTCTSVYDRYAVLRSATIREQQQANLNTQNTLETKLADARAALTVTERDYLEQYTEDTDGASSTAPKPTLSKKAVLLGFLAGGALLTLWTVLRYVFCRRVLSRADMALRYTFPVFGTVAGKSKREGSLRRWLKARLQDKPEPLPLIGAQIALAAGQLGAKSVYVTGYGWTADSPLPRELQETLTRQGIALTAGAYPTATVQGVEALAATEAVLLIETVDVSSHTDLTHTLELTDRCGKPVLGAILIQ